MAFELPPLPYPKNALEPYTSAQTLDFHHGKHHQAYVTNLNKLVEGTPMENKSLEEIIKATANDQSKAGIFNNAAQVWNHTFFWNCMKPNGGGAPTGDIAQAIDRDLGGLRQVQGRVQGAAPSASSAAAGPGSSPAAASSTITSTPNADRLRWRTARRRCSPATCGSTPTTSTTRTAGPTSCRRSSTT